MLDRETLQAMVGQGVPFNRLLGIQITKVEDGQVELLLEQKPEYLNHVGTFHAAAQFALAEATSGSIAVASLSDLLSQGVIPLATEANIKYRAPAKGNLRGVASLSAEELARIRAELGEKGRTRFSVKVQLLDGESKPVSEVEVGWILMKPQEK